MGFTSAQNLKLSQNLKGSAKWQLWHGHGAEALGKLNLLKQKRKVNSKDFMIIFIGIVIGSLVLGVIS